MKSFGRSKPNVMWGFIGNMEQNYANGLCHMTKMATMPMYSMKTLKNLLLQNQKSEELETWHGHQEPNINKVYINDDPGLTMTYSTERSK